LTAHEILWYVISCTTAIAPADKTVPATTGFDREMETRRNEKQHKIKECLCKNGS